MLLSIRFCICALALLMSASTAQAEETTIYELRIYHANPGKIADLETRFRDHTVDLFTKHGLTNVAYFRPTDDSDHRLIYLLSFPSVEAKAASWKAFLNDPDWKKAYQNSIQEGRLISRIESFTMKATDFSPALSQTESLTEGSRVFELRDYTATEGNLSHLHARFRDHTIGLFEKHGIHNVVYFELLEGEQTAENRLIYLITHPSQQQAKASFGEFRKDPAWHSARKASEAAAGGSLTIKGGVKSTFMRPVDFSPLK